MISMAVSDFQSQRGYHSDHRLSEKFLLNSKIDSDLTLFETVYQASILIFSILFKLDVKLEIVVLNIYIHIIKYKI